VNHAGATQITFTFGTHLGQNVASESVLSFEPTGGFAETLGSALFGFHFRHNALLLYCHILQQVADSTALFILDSLVSCLSCLREGFFCSAKTAITATALRRKLLIRCAHQLISSLRGVKY
jgi:hypothetical protein